MTTIVSDRDEIKSALYPLTMTPSSADDQMYLTGSNTLVVMILRKICCTMYHISCQSQMKVREDSAVPVELSVSHVAVYSATLVAVVAALYGELGC